MARTSASADPAPAGDGAALAVSPAPGREREGDRGGYTVVARRYRPQRFEDVVGQDHVVQALRNAIRLNRVTHAYLFSGTRGVGKTSMARIFAKALNCVHGPTETPCNQCEICRDIGAGQDVDVIEIDGASNNGVEAVRELRQNAGLRPVRSRFKIYYIDEVHMLSTGAFNALLKTLEEPPGHVKFFFATTEPNKIPITVLSRCQRYDFAGINPDQIVATLAEICDREGVRADADALRAVARRAGGSMRDAQSLLEQLLSVGDGTLTAETVHQSLGTAPDDRLLDLLDALADRDAAGVLAKVEAAVGAGVQPPELLSGLLEFLRDAMVLSAGADVGLLAVGPSGRDRLRKVVARWPLDSILAALQIVAEARGRLRGSPHGRTLVEVALLRVSRLEDLSDLGELVGRLAALDGGGPPPSKKKLTASEPLSAPTPPPAPVCVPPSVRSEGDARPAADPASPPPPAAPLSLEAVRAVWPEFLERVGVGLGTHLSRLAPSAISGPNTLVIPVPAGYNWVVDRCEAPEARDRIAEALRDLLGRPVALGFERSAEPPPASAPAAGPPEADELAGDPMVRRVIELFEARRIHVEEAEDS